MKHSIANSNNRDNRGGDYSKGSILRKSEGASMSISAFKQSAASGMLDGSNNSGPLPNDSNRSRASAEDKIRRKEERRMDQNGIEGKKGSCDCFAVGEGTSCSIQ